MQDFKYIILILIILFIVELVSRRTRRKDRGRMFPPDDEAFTKYGRGDKSISWVYEKKLLLSKAEYYFWRCLKAKCDMRGFIVCPKVRIEDFVTIKCDDYTTRQKYRGYIKSRHIDFLICDRDLNLLAGVELDDGSHGKDNAKKVDALKNDVFGAINLPLFRVKAGRNYDKEIDNLLVSLLGEVETKTGPRREDENKTSKGNDA